jgi:hypothetical protein
MKEMLAWKGKEEATLLAIDSFVGLAASCHKSQA